MDLELGLGRKGKGLLDKKVKVCPFRVRVKINKNKLSVKEWGGFVLLTRL